MAKGKIQTQTGKSREKPGTKHKDRQWIGRRRSTWQAAAFSAQILGGGAGPDWRTSCLYEVCHSCVL